MLTIQRENLLKPLQTVIGVIEKKQTMPILANAKICIDQDKLEVTGSDLEVELVGKTIIDQAVTSPIAITLPGRTLLDICRSLPDGSSIELFQDKDQVVVRSGQSRFSLASLPSDEFPSVEGDKENIKFSMPQSSLLRLLKLTQFAMAQNDVRYYLNGVMLEFQGSTLRAVATDGHRLNVNTETIDYRSDHRLQIIIPRKGVSELIRLLEDDDADIEISVSNNHIRVAANSLVFTSKLIDGRFPDYMPIFSAKCDKSVELPVEKLRSCLQRNAVVSQDKDHNVNFELRNNSLRIYSHNVREESAEEELAVDYDLEDITVCFNIYYLIDILNNYPYEHIRVSLTDSASSVLFESPETDAHLFVVMPIRL